MLFKTQYSRGSLKLPVTDVSTKWKSLFLWYSSWALSIHQSEQHSPVSHSPSSSTTWLYHCAI